MNYFLIKDKLNFEKKSKHKASEGNINGKYPFFTSSPILNKNIDSFDYNGEYLIFGTGGSPSMHYYNGKFATSTDCLVYNTTSKEIDLKFIYYYIKSNSNILENGFHGAGLKHISSNYINNIKVPLISLEKQKQIVSQLEKLEKLKEKKEQNIQRCDELIKSIFYDMFGDPVKNEKNWPKYKIEELCDTNSGGTPNRSKKEYYNGDIPWIKSGELNQGYIYSAEEYISKLGLDNSSAKLIPNNTVLLAMYGATAGKVGFLKITAATNQAICAISPKRDLNKIYLYFYLKTLEKQFINSSIGGGQPNISQKIIKRTDILVPPIDIQTKFGKKLQLIEKFKEKQVKSKEEIDNLFNGLMQKYFNWE